MASTPLPFVLSAADLTSITQLVRKGTVSARKLTRARVLQFSHQGQRPAPVSAALGVSASMVYNVRRRYRQEGLQAALSEKPRPGQPRKVTPAVEAELTAIACSAAPEGAARWTVALLNQRLVQLDIHVHDESVRLALKKASASPGSKSSGASGNSTAST